EPCLFHSFAHRTPSSPHSGHLRNPSGQCWSTRVSLFGSALSVFRSTGCGTLEITTSTVQSRRIAGACTVSLPVAAKREVRSGAGELFAPVRTRRTFENVIDQIVDSIRSGGLREGDQLPPERELAAKLEVSRPTVREAIRALADAGVVEVRPG